MSRQESSEKGWRNKVASAYFLAVAMFLCFTAFHAHPRWISTFLAGGVDCGCASGGTGINRRRQASMMIRVTCVRREIHLFGRFAGVVFPVMQQNVRQIFQSADLA